ncbi:MAG: metal-dependent phosphohydrolase sub domain [Herbinix sp.]|nr:metal-dependent phosphohydrolase sub domain [Herbinix sp.]
MSDITIEEKSVFNETIQELLQAKKVQEMKLYLQHGNSSTLSHSLVVTYYSYRLATRLPIRFSYKSLIRGAMLHDFYLYDWHIPDKSHRFHAFTHPRTSLINARRYFKLNSIEEDIILKHMWPLTIIKLPASRESLLVCIVDKVCSLIETFKIPIQPKDSLFHTIK